MGGHKFDGDLTRLDSPKRQEIMPVKTIIEMLGDKAEGLAIADLGCGTGYLAIPLAEHIGARGMVYAVDINPQMLEILKQKSNCSKNLQVLRSEENEIPVSNGEVDVSFLVTVFHELEDPNRFLTEIRRISKPSHRIIIIDWNTVVGEMGPPLDERISEDDVIKFFKGRGYGLAKRMSLSKYIYGLVFSTSC